MHCTLTIVARSLFSTLSDTIVVPSCSINMSSSSTTPNNNHQFIPINPTVLSENLSSPFPTGTNKNSSAARRTLYDLSTSFTISCNNSPSFTASNTTTSTPSDTGKNVASFIENTHNQSATTFPGLQGEDEDKKPAATAGKGGREKGATAYSADEHVALLTIMTTMKGSFNISECSPLWTSVYKQMCQEYYATTSPRLSSVLHGHFVDLYSSFKLGIRNLSLMDNSKKCPTKFEKGVPLADEYMVSLLALLTSDAKKYKSKKWWRFDVVELLLKNHLDYVAEFGSEKQSASWIAEKAIEHKNKFETDQRNQEAEMNCKRAVEEEECQDAVKQRKAVAESSVELVAAFK